MAYDIYGNFIDDSLDPSLYPSGPGMGGRSPAGVPELDPDLAAIARQRLQKREIPNTGPYAGENSTGLMLADLARGMGTALQGGSGADAIAAQQKSRTAMREKAIADSLASNKEYGSILDSLMKNKKDTAAESARAAAAKTMEDYRNANLDLNKQRLAAQIDANKSRVLESKNKAEAKKAEKTEKPPSQQQALAAEYGTMMEQAEGNIQDLYNSGYDPTSFANSVAKNLPGILKNPAMAAGLVDPNVRKELQAQLAFSMAILRRQSGAAISQSEFTNTTKQYFPQVGDTPEVVQQKKEGRQQALEGLKSSAGTAWNKVKRIGSSTSVGGDSDIDAELRRRGAL